MLEVSPIKDLTKDQSRPEAWIADGPDPQILIRFGLLRPPFLSLILHASTDLDPRVYINRGHGFREVDSVSSGFGRTFVLTADIGRFGTIRSLRLSPASHGCHFDFEYAAHATAAERNAWLEATRRRFPDRIEQALAKVPRYWRSLPNVFKGSHTSGIQKYLTAAEQRARAHVFASPASSGDPWLSIVVPVYDTPVSYLDQLLTSFIRQNVSGVELILSDDGSSDVHTRHWLDRHDIRPDLRIIRNRVNRGIAMATNAGLEVARGRFVAFLDHDDLIAPQALRLIQSALTRHPEANFLYTDEVIVSNKLKPIGLLLKPAYDPVLLSGVNYINHFSIYRRQRLKEIGNLRAGLDGSQDYDLLLRYLNGLDEASILHLPYPAYWWRHSPTSFSRRYLERSTTSARLALGARYGTEDRPAEVIEAATPTLHRVVFPPAPQPKISVIIPSRDSPDLIERVLTGLYQGTDYRNFDVIIVDNGSRNRRTLEIYKSYAAAYQNFHYDIEAAAFNFSAAVNRGVARATGDHVLLLNNDVEVLQPDWLSEMVGCLSYERCGIVGAKLLFPSRRIQHVGVIAGLGGLAGHWYTDKPPNFGGPFNRLHVRNSLSCVTGAVMLISGDCWRRVGPWDEDNFAIAYNDVDYCLRAAAAGFRCVWTPFAELIHHESISRGSDLLGDKRQRFEAEKARLRQIHHTEGLLDPALHPGYTRSLPDPVLRELNNVSEPRSWWDVVHEASR